MRWGWLFNRFADPQLDLTASQRQDAMRIVHKEYLRGKLLPFTLLAVIPPIAGALFVWRLSRGWFNSTYKLDPALTELVVIFISIVCTWIWSAFMYGRLYAKPYRKALQDMGFELCVFCGYSRDGLDPDAVCPECGLQRDEKV